MRHNYNSIDYWEGLIDKHKTIRGNMFMDSLPSKKSIYMHSLIFCKNNGLSNTWSYFPDEKSLLGYIQYSFLQECFYKWIYGKERVIVNIPNIPVEKIILDGERHNKITKEEADKMKEEVSYIKGLWALPKDKIIRKIKEFVRDFNKSWHGDNKEFLYLKVFLDAEELGEFVVKSNKMIFGKEFEDTAGISEEKWKEVCSKAEKSKVHGEIFRGILLKSLTEII